MYDKEKQKQKVLEMLRELSHDEMQYTKKQNFERAITFALDEVVELEQQFNHFLNRVSHLEVFQTIMKEPLTQEMNKSISNLRYLIEKNYTKEEKEQMPEDVFNQVQATQERRIDLLRNIARRYLSRTK
jgi:hypothetical protein